MLQRGRRRLHRHLVRWGNTLHSSPPSLAAGGGDNSLEPHLFVANERSDQVDPHLQRSRSYALECIWTSRGSFLSAVVNDIMRVQHVRVVQWTRLDSSGNREGRQEATPRGMRCEEETEEERPSAMASHQDRSGRS
ncbi:unnamed protein product [Prorocentrum cordatum]|uniref:Uncharacterized protein n=1 Tax=Prorocentrum cordatum TaxID=2364126 RepID=A0ABN9WM56_9DINO|nr:unnamed protein product [Polarella glacialis]